MSATTATKDSSVRNKHSSHVNKPSDGSYDAPKIDITKEEFSRISDALKNEEFRKLFMDYCEEIQDPENQKLYQQEMTQFEAERGVEVKFINPEPGFVIKTSVDGALKCFVNVAKSDIVAKPSNEVCMNPETGVRGLNWSIPMAQAGPRDDLDAQAKCCRVYDVIFHSDALYLSQRNSAFRKCLIDTALDAVEREYKVQLDRTNLKYPKLQFKGIAHPTVIRRLAKNAPPEASEPHPLDDVSPARPTADSGQPKVIPMKMNTIASAEFTIPKYLIKHRRDVDLAEYTNELDAKLSVTVPRVLVVEIELPLLKSTAECQLNVTAKSLYLLSERPGAKYRLKLDLPHTVDDNQGTARFDTDTRRLCITLPVIQQNSSQQRDMHETLLHLNREDSGVESDIREEVNSNSNSESPVEELSDSIMEEHATEANNDDSPISTSTLHQTSLATATFLKNSIHYQFPAKLDCNVLDNVMSLVLHVRNVQPESIATLQQSKSVHLRFISIGAGYYPTHYAFYLQLRKDSAITITTAEAEAWENNVVLNLNLATSSDSLHSYLAGLDSNDLKEYTVQGKFQLAHNSRQRKKSPPAPAISLSSSLDISVERSECERSVEIEIKPREQQSTCATNTKKVNKKQKKKNKKRRSLSESACDDIKAYHQHQQQQKEQRQQLQQQLYKISETNGDSGNAANHKQQTSISVAVPTVGNQRAAQQQLRKQRSYSECRGGDSMISSSCGSSTLPPSFKGILKRYSRYAPHRPSISDSCSSIDECSSSYSCSMDAGVLSSLRFSQSFSDIPEENVTAELSESCKKTVRFNEVIKKQVFRHDSSILGQRKKNQKRRDRKQRALQRRLSEGDSVDYEDNNDKPVALPTDEQYFKFKNNNNKNVNNDMTNQSIQHDSGLDLSDEKSSANKISSKCNKSRPRLESESSSDVETNKNSMIFEMDM